MARDFAISFYKSPAWLRNRKAYLQLPVDTSGHRLYQRNDGRFYWVDPQGYEIDVPSSCVVPPGMCERCFEMGEYTPAKVVHHITHISPENIDDPHVTLAFDNFQRLCQDCHAAVHSKVPERRWSFDDNGELVARR